MRHTRLLLLLFPALLALGCPGEWDEPLGPVAAGHIDRTIVGRWHCAADADAFFLSIVPFDEHQYVLTLTDPADARKEPSLLQGFTTTVNDHDVMNLRELGKERQRGAWSYARLLVLDGRLHLNLVESEPLQGVPEDVESRALAIGDLFEFEDLWSAGPRCVPVQEPDRPGSPLRIE